MNQSIQVQLKPHSNGLCDCPGFLLSATSADIRGTGDPRLDLAVFAAESPCPAAGVFTLNDVCAAPVRICQSLLASNGEYIGGCVINSGNANACTGEEGLENAQKMSSATQAATGINAPFLPCSTGRIGRQLPMMNILSGIQSSGTQLSDKAEVSLQAADAILTSDTHRKVATARFTYEGKEITVAGMAKGAGMIEPNMATMLAFLATDLEVDSSLLKDTLTEACNLTFNRISIDGDMSTNDTVLLFSGGKSGINVLASTSLLDAFKKAVYLVCDALAEKIVGDGEKVTKLVELIVKGSKTVSDAEKLARAVGNSLLVKTSWYGSDPNWGRLADAAGYARVGLDETRFDIHYDDVPALLSGIPQENNINEWKSIVSKKRFRITLNLNQGSATYRLLTSDLSEAYVDFNKSE